MNESVQSGLQSIDRNVIRETVTSQTDQPVDQIIFYRVSEE
jgi:hypothetical protein